MVQRHRQLRQPRVSAALIKNDAGTWTLWGQNTYNGNTLIAGGLLVVNGQITGSTNISVNTGGALGGTGLITAPVTVTTGAVLAPGGSIGTLTISNTLTLSPGSTCVFDVSNFASDQVRGLTTVNYDGLLQVVQNGALSANGVFKLFDATNYSGVFASFDLLLPPETRYPVGMVKKLFLLDGMALVYRAHFAFIAVRFSRPRASTPPRSTALPRRCWTS